MPELKRVIVFFSDKIVMEADLPAALERLFSGNVFVDQGPAPGETRESRLHDLAVRAMNHYNQAEANLRDGNWAKYGENIRMLGEILQRMNATR